MTAILYGTLKDDGTLQLDDKVNGLPPGRVRVVVEEASSEPGWWVALQRIWADQDARGYRRKTKEEVDQLIAEMRADYDEDDERWRELWALQGDPTSKTNE